MKISKHDLDMMVDRLNIAAGTPRETWSRDETGKLKPNAFNYHLSGAYGGYQVQQICTEGFGASNPITGGHVTKRECYETLCVFIKGVESVHIQKCKDAMIANYRKDFPEDAKLANKTV
tara:strand:+ start:989 stop:1345 length:357 start_codon:yes stop_codon:yes gene_type:complete